MKRTFTCLTNSLILSLAILLITGCSKKDEVGTNFPITIIVTKFDSSSSIRLFDKNGEIKDQAAITKFIKGSKTFENQEGNSYHNGKVTFLSNIEMQMGEPSPNNVKYAVEVLSNDRIQYSVETTIPYDPFTDDHIGLIQGTEILFRLPDGSRIILYKRLLYGNFTSFKLPMLRYLEITDLSSGEVTARKSRSEGTALGEFNEEYIKTLRNGQTLAIQQVYAELKKM